jgi:CAP N-terminal conserved motif
MNELEQAAQRLEQAVTRLEAASRRSGDRKPGAKPGAASNDTAATVAVRLDEAILRLDRLLEN